jgi:lipopolysaccharide/colanic/teichoic acid biosynthesis glycosyltransferase
MLLAWRQVWMGGTRLDPGWSTAGVFALSSLTAFSFEFLLLWLPGLDDWAYRLGFLLGLAVALVGSYPLWSGQPPLLQSLVLLVACLGTLVGSLALSGWRDGLWEDNAPPPRAVQDEVARWHQEKNGLPKPTPLVKRTLAKRLFDIGLSAGSLLLSLPLTLLIAFFIWFEDPGPVIFVKNSVGKGGTNFRQLKFRTMIREAERTTGPVLASEGDQRILRTGHFLRKTALDELPQLINILVGEMSFVGPRPQRTVLVHGYLQHVPGYAERHCVSPGLAGLAQVAGSYYISAQEKLKWDRIYIRRAGLGFDIRLILLAFLLVFYYRWRKGGDERLPERWLRKL